MSARSAVLPLRLLRSYKVGIPVVRDHVRRTALLRRLESAGKRAPITWVVGLPGAGKTSVVARFLEESRTPTFWYRLDHDDADGAAFFDALCQAHAGTHGPLPVWSPENQVELAEFSRSFFTELSRKPLTLVLDDCHRVGDDSALLTMLASFHEACGDTLRLVLVSRRAPPPSIAHGVIGGWLDVVDGLRLTKTEVRELAHLVRDDKSAKITSDEQRALDSADGWLAHVLALCRRPSSTVDLAGMNGARVGDFLAEELLASVPKAERAGLRRLAELPEIPADGASSRVAPEVLRLLATLSSQKYFVDRTRDRYRLHDLLRDALLRKNAEEDSPSALRDVRRDLATWIEAAMPETAVELRAAAADTEGVLALLEKHGGAWLGRGLHRTVTVWLSPLPEPERAEDRAALWFWRAQALLPTDPEAARPLFANARKAAVSVKDRERAYAAWCGEVASYVIQWGAVHGLADLVDDLEALHLEVGPPEGDLAFRTSADALTALMYGRAEDPRIGRFAEATARAITHAPDAGARISAAAQLLIYKMWWSGDFPGGRALYDTFDREVSEGEHLPALPRLLWWSCASIVDWQCGEPAECYRKVDRGLLLAASSGVHVRDFFLLTQGIFCALSQEDWPRAEDYLALLARTERTHKRLDAMVHHFFRSWYALSRGDPRTALAHATSAWVSAEAMGSMFHKIIVLSALAPARVHTGDLEGADKAYRDQLALAKAAQNPTFSFIAFCAAAEIALARKDEIALKKQVERILLVKHLGGFHSCCGWRTPMMQELLAFALANDIHREVAQKWIREKKIRPPKSPPIGWPMPVQIEALEGLVVRVDGRDEDPERGGKSARKLRELVAVLAVSKSGATHQDLTDWLWPDAEGDKAVASLKAAIHRVRQWLGADAVRVYEGRVSLNPIIVDCDLWRLESRAEPPIDKACILAGFDLPPIRMLRQRLARPTELKS